MSSLQVHHINETPQRHLALKPSEVTLSSTSINHHLIKLLLVLYLGTQLLNIKPTLTFFAC